MTEDKHIESFNNKLKEMCNIRSETSFFVDYSVLISDELHDTMNEIFIRMLFSFGIMRWEKFTALDKAYQAELKRLGYDKL